MKVFRDLKFIGSDSEQEKLLDQIEQHLDNGWIRARDKEIEFNSRDRMEYKIFTCSQAGSRPAAALFFCPDKNGYFYACNIVPKDVGELEQDGYNAIMSEFQTQFLEPASKGLDVQIITTPAERNIDNFMSPEIAQLLKRFSDAANKSSGGTHPLDESRFFEFIVQAHQENSLLNEGELKSLLVDDGWSEEYAFELSCNYRFGRDLLKHHESGKNQGI